MGGTGGGGGRLLPFRDVLERGVGVEAGVGVGVRRM
jgi:hypothetical protein